jgi:hypothetical protein
VPFGFRGTVVTIHANTKFVEVSVLSVGVLCYLWLDLCVWRRIRLFLMRSLLVARACKGSARSSAVAWPRGRTCCWCRARLSTRSSRRAKRHLLVRRLQRRIWPLPTVWPLIRAFTSFKRAALRQLRNHRTSRLPLPLLQAPRC